MLCYILDDNETPIPVDFSDERFMELYRDPKHRRVGLTDVGDKSVSTVFLAIEHGTDDDGRPLLWETMVFNKHGKDLAQCRYSSAADARAGHELVVTLVGLNKLPLEQA